LYIQPVYQPPLKSSRKAPIMPFPHTPKSTSNSAAKSASSVKVARGVAPKVAQDRAAYAVSSAAKKPTTPPNAASPLTTRTFKSGNSIAVRIPAKFNPQPGKTMLIQQRGSELILVEEKESLASLIDIFKAFPKDAFEAPIADPPPEPVAALDSAAWDIAPGKSKATPKPKPKATPNTAAKLKRK
jgi:virulence-associated protein VagC